MHQRLVENCLKSTTVAIEVRTFSLNDGAQVANHFEDTCFIAFKLWPRPGVSRGRYAEVWGPSRYETMGDIVFVPNGVTMIGTGSSGPRRYLACNLDVKLFANRWNELSERAFVESLAIKSTEVKHSLRRLLRETTEPSLSSPIALDAIGTLLAIDIERHLEGFKDQPTRKTGGLSPARMRLIEERLRPEHPVPTLVELADYCNLSTRHLARAFREETGRAIGEFVSTAARERACNLLSTTDLPIRIIAERVGFSSPASFCYAFRKTTGFRPSDLRKSARAIGGAALRVSPSPLAATATERS